MSEEGRNWWLPVLLVATFGLGHWIEENYHLSSFQSKAIGAAVVIVGLLALGFLLIAAKESFTKIGDLLRPEIPLIHKTLIATLVVMITVGALWFLITLLRWFWVHPLFR